MSKSETTPAEGPTWLAAVRRAASAQHAIMHDEQLWQAHCEEEQDAANAFMRSRIMAGRAPLATALAAVALAGAQWAAVSNPSERKHGEAVLMQMLRDAMAHGYDEGKAYGKQS